MNWYHVEGGTIIKRLRKAPIMVSDPPTQDELDRCAAQDVYPENRIEPAREDWERRGGQALTFNEAEQRVDKAWTTEEMPLAEYKRRLVMAAINAEESEADFPPRLVSWAEQGKVPQAFADIILAEDAAIRQAIGSKIMNIRKAANHADAKTAFDA